MNGDHLIKYYENGGTIRLPGQHMWLANRKIVDQEPTHYSVDNPVWHESGEIGYQNRWIHLTWTSLAVENPCLDASGSRELDEPEARLAGLTTSVEEWRGKTRSPTFRKGSREWNERRERRSMSSKSLAS